MQGRALRATHTSLWPPAWLPGTHSQTGSSSGLRGPSPGLLDDKQGQPKVLVESKQPNLSLAAPQSKRPSLTSYYSTPLLLRGGQPWSPKFNCNFPGPWWCKEMSFYQQINSFFSLPHFYQDVSGSVTDLNEGCWLLSAIPRQARRSLSKYLWMTHIHFPECRWEKLQLIKSHKRSFILHWHIVDF